MKKKKKKVRHFILQSFSDFQCPLRGQVKFMKRASCSGFKLRAHSDTWWFNEVITGANTQTYVLLIKSIYTH